jgi:hypothetical protein
MEYWKDGIMTVSNSTFPLLHHSNFPEAPELKNSYCIIHLLEYSLIGSRITDHNELQDTNYLIIKAIDYEKTNTLFFPGAAFYSAGFSDNIYNLYCGNLS